MSLGSKRGRPLVHSSDDEHTISPSKRQRQSSQVASSLTSANLRTQSIVVDDDDDLEEITSSQRLEADDLESLGHIACKIVGVRYYTGIATLDEKLLLIREPRNPYDRNAIRVDNVANIQVGQYDA